MNEWSFRFRPTHAKTMAIRVEPIEVAITDLVHFVSLVFRHLNGCMLDGISRPHLLITDAYNADYVSKRRRVCDETLMSE